MCIETENDVCFDEEFFNYAVKKYGKELMNRVFFFVDNRNVIGKGRALMNRHNFALNTVELQTYRFSYLLSVTMGLLCLEKA
jgi:hypothetical protein